MDKPVSVYYDKLCAEHTYSHFEEFDSDYDDHPEKPERVINIFEHIQNSEVFEKLNVYKNNSFYPTYEQLERVHDPEYSKIEPNLSKNSSKIYFFLIQFLCIFRP